MHGKQLTLMVVLLMAELMFAGNAWSTQAGRVQFVNGDVQVTDVTGHVHPIQKGDPINEGDTLTSAKTASAQIKMQDGGFIAIRPDTKLKFDSFKFSGKADEPESSFFSLFKGGFRAITGLIGRVRHQDYRITTPVATIGIRGTDHETVMVLPDNPLVLAGQAEAGAYNKVNVGETSITTDKGVINVLPNQMGFAGGLNQMPQIRPINTSLFTVVPQPSPGAKMDGGKGGEQGARDTAVVDPTTQQVTGGSTPVGGAGNVSVAPSIAPPTQVITPNSALGVTTAPFVNTDITWDVASELFGTGVGIAGPPSNVSPMPSPTSFYAVYNCNGNCNDSFGLTLSGGTPMNFSDAATGIQWGYWTGVNSATEVITGASPSTTSYSNPGVISWITAPSSSFILPMVLTGTANYNLINGVATDGGTSIGTVTSASLSVNFTQQLVNMALNATANGATWVVTGTGASLGYSGQGNSGFSFSTSPNTACTGCAQGTLSFTGSSGISSPTGNVYGDLTGTGLTGAILSYALHNGDGSNLFGVAALGLSPSTPINAAQPYQVALSSIPMIPITPYPNSSNPYPVVMDTANGAAFSPAAFGLSATGGYFPQINSNMIDALAWGGITGPASATISGASAVDTGTDPVSGIQWGRWSGSVGTINFVALNGSGSYSMTMPAGGVHWIVLPASSGPNSLPVSGTFNYVLAGYTNPTDQAGHIGTLNSASLTANFSNMTVNMAANVSVAGTTFIGSATGVPIQQGMVFGNNAGLGTVSCSGSCGYVTSGNAVGAFTQGGVGAAVTYGFQTGPTVGSPTVVVGGVAAFHR